MRYLIMFNGALRAPINLSWAENWAHLNTKKPQICNWYQTTNTAYECRGRADATAR